MEPDSSDMEEPFDEKRIPMQKIPKTQTPAKRQFEETQTPQKKIQTHAQETGAWKSPWEVQLLAFDIEDSMRATLFHVLTEDLFLPMAVESLVKYQLLPYIEQGTDKVLQTNVKEIPYPALFDLVLQILKDLQQNEYVTLEKHTIGKREMYILKARDVVVITRQAQTMSLRSTSQEIEDFIDSSACEPPMKRKKIAHSATSLITSRSVVDRSLLSHQTKIDKLIHTPTALHQSLVKMYQTPGGPVVREFCPYGVKRLCRQMRGKSTSCPRIHYIRIVKAHTIVQLGDCSYLDGCRHMNSCRYIHYEIDKSIDSYEERYDRERATTVMKTPRFNHKFDAQWINCDIRRFPVECLGKYSVIMADPPWDIHMELPYGTLKDQELLDLPVSVLCDAGVMCLWITGRVVELARKCLRNWGYECVQELIWVKTNQLQRLIRTGRTGHWINHSKEHCLIGVKGNPKLNTKIDCEIVVSEVRETSRKPDEIYNLLERLSPGTPKLEIFGRMHNTRPGWVTLGNQLPYTRILDPKLLKNFHKEFPGFPVHDNLQSRPPTYPNNAVPCACKGLPSIKKHA